MIELKKKEIANSRFVFLQLSDDLSSWQQILGKIDNFIKDESRLERANPFAYIYFLPENIFWVGREVIGPPHVGDSPLILDFKGGVIHSCLIESGLELNQKELLALKNRMCQDNLGEIDGSIPWRLRIDLEKEDKIPLNFEFFGQNYPFPKLTK